MNTKFLNRLEESLDTNEIVACIEYACEMKCVKTYWCVVAIELWFACNTVCVHIHIIKYILYYYVALRLHRKLKRKVAQRREREKENEKENSNGIK